LLIDVTDNDGVVVARNCDTQEQHWEVDYNATLVNMAHRHSRHCSDAAVGRQQWQ